jgi:cytochrome c oxidase subunit II
LTDYTGLFDYLLRHFVSRLYKNFFYNFDSMHAGFIFLAVIVGSVLFHIFTPWWWTDIASNWGAMDDTINLTFWIGGGVFILVCLFMIYCMLKFSYKEGRKVEYKPEDHKLEKILTIVTTIGVVALLAPGLVVYNQYINTPKNALNIEVMAWQWGWQYRLPGEDGKLGTTQVAKITDENPFGINLDDEYGKDDILIQSDELHLKKNKPVKILLRSVDVLHNFYVPQFRAKMDAIPGIISYYWFEPNKIGEYEVLCAEYCGVGHYAMRAKVVVDNDQNYENWLSEQEMFSDYVAKQNKIEFKKTRVAKNNN